MKPTEHEMTVAVDAGARRHYDDLASSFDVKRTFDDLGPLEALDFRETVLPVVIAALEALPDRLDPIRAFHDAWGDTEDADPLALWEDLGRLLGVTQ